WVGKFTSERVKLEKTPKSISIVLRCFALFFVVCILYFCVSSLLLCLRRMDSVSQLSSLLQQCERLNTKQESSMDDASEVDALYNELRVLKQRQMHLRSKLFVKTDAVGTVLGKGDDLADLSTPPSECIAAETKKHIEDAAAASGLKRKQQDEEVAQRL